MHLQKFGCCVTIQRSVFGILTDVGGSDIASSLCVCVNVWLRTCKQKETVLCNYMITIFHLVQYLFYYCEAVIYKSFTRQRFGGELNINLSITSVCKQIDELLDC